MQLSIVVPCYNEADNLVQLIGEFREAIGGRDAVELLLVNNGSTDHSSEVLKSELSRHENRFARVVNVVKNQGYGFGILSGLRAAQGDFLAWTHADLQTDPKDVLKAFEQIQSEAEPQKCLVRGVRCGRPMFDRIFTHGMSLVASVALQSPLSDINAQPKVFHRSLMDEMRDAPWDFSLDLYLLHLANRLGLKILYQPVIFGNRQRGEAKGGGSFAGKIRLTKRTLRYIGELRQKLRAAA